MLLTTPPSRSRIHFSYCRIRIGGNGTGLSVRRRIRGPPAYARRLLRVASTPAAILTLITPARA